MLRIDRSRVTLPPDLVERLHFEQQKLIAFQHAMGAGSKRYQQQTFNYHVIRDTHPFLKELFVNKCAYCETSLVGQSGDVENFRPKGAIEERDGKVLREGYWWLAHEWANLYLACATCNRLHKRNKFPIAGPRAKPMAKGRKLLTERALLLDPCEDDPSSYLWFLPDGSVQPQVPTGLKGSAATKFAADRAVTTIEVLGLNRSDLVYARHRVRVLVEALVPQLMKKPSSDLAKQAVGSDKPYVAAATQWLIELLRGRRLSLRDILDLLRASGASVLDEDTIKKAAQTGRRTIVTPSITTPQAALKGTAAEILTGPLFGLESTRPPVQPTPPEALVAAPIFIKRIRLKNFKALRDLVLELPILDLAPDVVPTRPDDPDPGRDSATTSRTGWFVLLGENAVGKSSILEAIALAVMGEAHLRALVATKVLSLSKLVHLPPGEDPAANKRTCVIRLTLAPEEHGEIELRITRASFKFTKGGSQLPTLIRGYGFVRLLPRPGDDPDRTVSLARCDNLFNPRTPLCDAERWMSSLPYDDTKTSSFDIAARTILELLPRTASIPDANAEPEAHLEPRDGRVVMTLKQRELSIDQLSSGYQSVVALAADIMSGIPADRLFDMREACGIVLLDEIGTQLHPRWRMHAIDDLRKAFPGIQFIATTHEPLCLKGVDGKEVAVLRRDGPQDDVTVTAGGFPNPRTLRIDQLLTSPYFGLDSTIDPDTDRLFQRYYELLAKGSMASALEQTERRQLELKLAPHRGLGYTRSDRAVYELVDRFLAEEGADTRARAGGVSEEVRQQVFDIWRNVAARHRGQP